MPIVARTCQNRSCISKLISEWKLYQLNHNLIITYYYNWKSYHLKSNANTQYHGYNFYYMCCDQSPVFHALVYVCF